LAETAPSGTSGQLESNDEPAVTTGMDTPPVTTEALPLTDATPDANPQADTAGLEQPIAGQAEALPDAPQTQDGSVQTPGSDTVTVTDAVRPATPTAEGSPPAAPTEPPAPQGNEAIATPVPSDSDTAAVLPQANESQPQIADAATPATPQGDTTPNVDFSNPTVVETPEDVVEAPLAQAADPAAEITEGASDAQPQTVVVGQLPTVQDDDPAPVPETAEPDGEEEAFPPGTPALVRYARAFDHSGEPLVSIILITDARGELEKGGAALPFPVTYAIDGSSFAARGLMEKARAQDQEIVALAPLPATVTADDVNTSFEVYLKRLDQAVAVMDEIQASFQLDREVATAVAYQADRDGHGIITYPRGLNSGVQVAEREGVPVALVFREFDSAGQDRAAMKRFLDQAAFRAGQESGVILVGHDRPETIAALLEWRLGTRAETVTLAPISAILRDR
jgi:polysaccharide deacetylase 2 family uncharacterized protein YibQ